MTKRRLGLAGIILLMIAIAFWAALPKHGGNRVVTPAVFADKPKPIDAPSNSRSIQKVASDSQIVHSGQSSTSPIVAGQSRPPVTPGPHFSRDMSVVGQRFAVSPSIGAACNDPGLKAVKFCDRLQASLAEMSKEPRETAWSADMETKLQGFVDAQDINPSIRNIECRSSWCPVEVASMSKAFNAVIPYANPLSKQLGAAADSWARK